MRVFEGNLEAWTQFKSRKYKGLVGTLGQYKLDDETSFKQFWLSMLARSVYSHGDRHDLILQKVSWQKWLDFAEFSRWEEADENATRVTTL